MTKISLLVAVTALFVLAGCNGTDGYHRQPSGPMASGYDRTFSVPVYGRDDASAQASALAAATRECQRLMLFPKVVRDEGTRIVYECVSERPNGY